MKPDANFRGEILAMNAYYCTSIIQVTPLCALPSRTGVEYNRLPTKLLGLVMTATLRCSFIRRFLLHPGNPETTSLLLVASFYDYSWTMDLLRKDRSFDYCPHLFWLTFLYQLPLCLYKTLLFMAKHGMKFFLHFVWKGLLLFHFHVKMTAVYQKISDSSRLLFTNGYAKNGWSYQNV